MTQKLWKNFWTTIKLFCNASRHHVYELVIEAVYNCLLGDSSGPEDANFTSFKSCWLKINKSRNCRILDVSSKFLQDRKKIISELQDIIEKNKTKETFIRGEYKQCEENALALQLQFIDTQEKKTSITEDLKNKEHRITLRFSSLDAPFTHVYCWVISFGRQKEKYKCNAIMREDAIVTKAVI